MTDHAYLTVEEAGAILRVSRNRAYQLAASGDMPTIRIGRLLRVPRRRFEEWLAGQEVKA